MLLVLVECYRCWSSVTGVGRVLPVLVECYRCWFSGIGNLFIFQTPTAVKSVKGKVMIKMDLRHGTIT